MLPTHNLKDAFFDSNKKAHSTINLTEADWQLKNRSAAHWETGGRKNALILFNKASRRVPAYKHFLKHNRINPLKIRTYKDFQAVPFVDKKNYFERYSLADLCWDGKIESNLMLSVSSGSSGKPFFWPRGAYLETETAYSHGLILYKLFEAKKNKTLLVDTFSMGIYVAGVIILNSALRAARDHSNLSIMTPGVEIQDTLRVIREIAPYYDQVIIAGYPPFVKDIIDAGVTSNFGWKKYKINFLFAAENYSEEFRTALYKKIGQNSRSFNIYGSAEAGIMAHETPLTVSIRKLAQTNGILRKVLFGSAPFLPTFAQFNPFYKYFEVESNELVLTARAGIPLIRYNIHDRGNIISFEKLAAISKKFLRNNGQLNQNSWKLPALAVYGKADKSISFYGVKIYPENIKNALENKNLQNTLSGKFVMRKKNDYWLLDLELANNKELNNSVRTKISDQIFEVLKKKNLEYGRLSAALGKKAMPRVHFFKKGESKLFNPKAVKQKWLATSA